MKFRKSHWVNLAMIAALLGTAVAGHYFSPLLLPAGDVTGVVEPGCDLQKEACTGAKPGIFGHTASYTIASTLAR